MSDTRRRPRPHQLTREQMDQMALEDGGMPMARELLEDHPLWHAPLATRAVVRPRRRRRRAVRRLVYDARVRIALWICPYDCTDQY